MKALGLGRHLVKGITHQHTNQKYSQSYKIESMIRKYHNHTLQTNPRHRDDQRRKCLQFLTYAHKGIWPLPLAVMFFDRSYFH